MGYEWPQQVHGITVDAKDRVWISGNAEKDTQILVFTREGKFSGRSAVPGKSGGNNDTANVARATQMRIDARSNEVYVRMVKESEPSRDCVRLGNGRLQTALGRVWREAGRRRSEGECRSCRPAVEAVRNAVHCLRFDRDGLVYVCDRSNSRVQIFRKDGAFQKEFFVAKASEAAGTVATSISRQIRNSCTSPTAESESLDLSARSTAGRRLVRRAWSWRRTVCHYIARFDGRLQGKRVHGRSGQPAGRVQKFAASERVGEVAVADGTMIRCDWLVFTPALAIALKMAARCQRPDGGCIRRNRSHVRRVPA